MSQYKQHFFVCINARPPFAQPSCGPQGGHQILMLLQEQAEARGLLDRVKITGCSCLGPCEDGPMMVVYPEATWYGRVTPDDVPEIVESHMLNGQPVERLLFRWPESL